MLLHSFGLTNATGFAPAWVPAWPPGTVTLAKSGVFADYEKAVESGCRPPGPIECFAFSTESRRDFATAYAYALWGRSWELS